MVIYLLVISLILHAVTFLWIILLMQKMNEQKFKSEALDANKVTREVEDLLVAYTEEMKENNEKLLNELLKQRNNDLMTDSSEQRLEKNNDHIEVVEVVEEGIENQPEKQLNRSERFADYEPPVSDDEQAVFFEQSDTLKVLTLAKQGLTVTEIAKKLNIGKGEVELLLKFYQ